MSLTTLLTILGAGLALVVVALGAYVLFNAGSVQRRIEGLFRRPERPAKTAGDEQYYRPYWSR